MLPILKGDSGFVSSWEGRFRRRRSPFFFHKGGSEFVRICLHMGRTIRRGRRHFFVLRKAIQNCSVPEKDDSVRARHFEKTVADFEKTVADLRKIVPGVHKL